MAETTGRALRPGRAGHRFPIGSAGRLGGALRLPGRSRRYLHRRPETPALLVAAMAWPMAVVLHGVAGHDGDATGLRAAADLHHGHGARGAGASAGAPTPVELLAWVVMVVAMMVPLVWPAVRHVGFNSLRWRRQRAVAVFLAVYVAVWTAFGAVALLVRGLLPVPLGPAFAAALAVAALWQLSPQQRGFRWACHRTVPLPPRGLPALAGDVRFGLRQGMACVGVCWPLMLAMALVPGAMVLWMAVLTAAMACAKLAPGSCRLSRPLAIGLGAAAVLTLVATPV